MGHSLAWPILPSSAHARFWISSDPERHPACLFS
jgi:hypothetical protein